MYRDFLRPIAIAFLLVLAAIIVYTGRASDGFVDWFKTYQTILAGFLAVAAAWITIVGMRWIENDKVQREQYAARAVLPPVSCPHFDLRDKVQ